MRKRRSSDYVDPTAHHYGLTQANFNLLTKLIPWLDEHQKQDTKFKMAITSRIARIESMLVQVLGCTLADFWADDKPNMTEQKRNQYIKEVDEKINSVSQDLGLRIVKYVYGDGDASGTGGCEPRGRPGRRRRGKWSGGEI